jgi:hypothetical protein
VDSLVVCFESGPADGAQLHTTVQTSGIGYMLPPFTLLTVVRVEEPGEWEYLPGKRIQQRCITVRPTYVTPKHFGGGGVDANRFVTNRHFLSYGSADQMHRGLAEITEGAPLTMVQEWARDYRWVDWKGVEHCGWQEWLYVSGTVPDRPLAAAAEAAESGLVRDVGHEGWTLDLFVQRANDVVRASAAARGVPAHEIEPMLLLHEEVTAIRLYTGPAYQPLNEFLREVSKLGPQWRRQLASSHQFSYASTVLHLSDGLRKLARAQENFGTVYRGVRGELPEAFWLRDAFGMVTATDFGFMSTTPDRPMSERFLGSHGKTVLWQIECSRETDEGFHSPADVSALSQYPQEKEQLFPPMTMLQVHVQEVATPRPGAQLLHQPRARRSTLIEVEARRTQFEKGVTTKGAQYICIRVTPTFV